MWARHVLRMELALCATLDMSTFLTWFVINCIMGIAPLPAMLMMQRTA